MLFKHIDPSDRSTSFKSGSYFVISHGSPRWKYDKLMAATSRKGHDWAGIDTNRSQDLEERQVCTGCNDYRCQFYKM